MRAASSNTRKTKLSPSEHVVQDLFRDRCSVRLEKIPEANGATPDFEWIEGARRLAVVEVKEVTYQGRTIGLRELESTDGLIAGSLRNDNAVSRAARKMHEAVKQFECFEEPKVLVLVNNEIGADALDLKEALQGYLMYDDGECVQNVPPDVTSRVARDRHKIDLYLWIDRFGPPEAKLAFTSEAGRNLAHRLQGLKLQAEA